MVFGNFRPREIAKEEQRGNLVNLQGTYSMELSNMEVKAIMPSLVKELTMFHQLKNLQKRKEFTSKYMTLQLKCMIVMMLLPN